MATRANHCLGFAVRWPVWLWRKAEGHPRCNCPRCQLATGWHLPACDCPWCLEARASEAIAQSQSRLVTCRRCRDTWRTHADPPWAERFCPTCAALEPCPVCGERKRSGWLCRACERGLELSAWPA